VVIFGGNSEMVGFPPLVELTRNDPNSQIFRLQYTVVFTEQAIIQDFSASLSNFQTHENPDVVENLFASNNTVAFTNLCQNFLSDLSLDVQRFGLSPDCHQHAPSNRSDVLRNSINAVFQMSNCRLSYKKFFNTMYRCKFTM